MGGEISAMGSLFDNEVFENVLLQERPTKKRRKEKHKSKKKRKKEEPPRMQVERTHVLNEETNTHTIYEDGEEKWRDQTKGQEVQRTMVIDAETDTLTVYENEKEVVVAAERPQANRRKENAQPRNISTKPGGKRHRSPNAFSPRRRKHRSVLESHEPSRVEIEPKRPSVADTFAIRYSDAVDEPVLTPEIPSKKQEYRPRDPRLPLRTSLRRRRESSEPASDPIQSPNWSVDGEPTRKPISRRRIGKESVFKWPNKDLSWMGPMKAEDFNPEIAAMERRLFTPDKTTGLFSCPPKRASTPRRSMARLSPKADTVNPGPTQRPASTKTSCEQKLSNESDEKKSTVEISCKMQSVNKEDKGVKPIEADNLTLVDDLIIIEESE